MKHLISSLARIYQHYMRDSLYSNSLFLMGSMVITAISGFIFLIVIARIYDITDIGRATATISLIGFLANLSILGLNNAVIRYAKSLQRLDAYVNTAVTIIAGSAFVVGSLFVLNTFWLSRKLVFVSHSMPLTALVIILTILASVNIFTDSVFIAKRIAIYILVENIFLGIIKIFFPLFFYKLGYSGVMLSYGFSILGALCVTVVGFKKFGYKLTERPNFKLLQGTKGYAFGNYISGIASSGAPMLVPAIALNALGASQSAYFYAALMIATLLLVIPTAINRSLFAEGVHDETLLKEHIHKSIRLIVTLLALALVFVIVIGRHILALFGSHYSTVSYEPMLILCASAVFASVISVVGTVLNIRHKIKEMTIMNLLGFGCIILGSALESSHGIKALSIGWFMGQAVSAVLAIGFYFSYCREKNGESI